MPVKTGRRLLNRKDRRFLNRKQAAKTASPVDGRRLLNRKEAAEYLGIRPATLAFWHSTGRHSVRVVKLGTRVLYRVADLDAFIASRTVTNSDEAAKL